MQLEDGTVSVTVVLTVVRTIGHKNISYGRTTVNFI